MKVAFALVAALALTGCGSTTVEPAVPSTPDAPPQLILEGPTLSPDPTPAVTPCSRLLAEGWEPSPFKDFDVNTSPTLDVAEFKIGIDWLFLDIRNDLACQRLPTLGPVIARLLADAPHLPPVTEDLRSISELFLDFARSSDPEHPGPPADTSIDLYVGGELQKVIPASRINDRQEWRTCPEGGYAARSCPISPLLPFANYPGPIEVTSQPPAHVCVPEWRLPERLYVYRSVTLTPDESRDCTSYFAIQLFVNDVGQIVAANLVLSDP